MRTLPNLLLALSLVVPAIARADDDEAIAELTRAVADQMSLLNVCGPYKDGGASRASRCQAAQSAGWGLSCPPVTATKVTSEVPADTCDASLWTVLEAKLGANAMARFFASGRHEYTAIVRATVKPVESIADHRHQETYVPAGKCEPEYVYRKDEVQGFFAVYKKSKVSLTIPAPNAPTVAAFVADVNENQGRAAAVSGTVCGWKPHPGKPECSATASSTSTAVTPCSGHADCAKLPCGEWICDAGACKQVQAAPDGTPCAGGTCAAGKCNPQ